jgi:hypothetical protein
MTRVLRHDQPLPLEVKEERCFFCGEEMRDGKCGRRCHASRRDEEGQELRVERLDIEET